MDLLKNLGEILSSTKKNISEKGKKASAAAKLRNIIMTEEKACERAYIALGKYYYHSLRDRNDLSAEPYCASLDTSKDKIDKAARKLEIYYKDEPEKRQELKEEISEIMGLDISKVTRRVNMLEIKGYIVKTGHSKYEISERAIK